MDIVTNHPEAKIISMSFGACERLDRADFTLFGAMYAQAAVQGQTVLVAAGDNGADDCQDRRGRSVNVLASNANVTAVGGTALDAGFDAHGDATGYVGETVWNDADGASGGGVSTLVSKPGYQSAPGVPADGFRDLPDVSLLASPSNAGYVMVADGSVVVTGGASAAAPSWAGIVALLNHAMHVDGSGPVNAALYALGREQYAGSGTAVFHDVTLGNNSFRRRGRLRCGTRLRSRHRPWNSRRGTAGANPFRSRQPDGHRDSHAGDEPRARDGDTSTATATATATPTATFTQRTHQHAAFNAAGTSVRRRLQYVG